MSNTKKFLKLFLYAGLEKEEYHQLLPDIREENRQLLYVFSQIGAIMFLLLFIASMLSHGFATTNSTTYLISGVLMIVILFSTVLYLPKYPMLIMPFVYLFEIVLYSFGIRISLLHADKAAVSAIAFLLVSPLLFYDGRFLCSCSSFQDTGSLGKRRLEYDHLRHCRGCRDRIHDEHQNAGAFTIQTD